MEKEKKDPKEIAKGCGVFIAIGIIIWAIYIVGCSGDEKEKESTVITNEKVIITKEKFGDKWPFSVSEGELYCDKSAVFFIAGGKKYALNGIALSMAPNNPKIEEIWLWDDEITKEMKANGYSDKEAEKFKTRKSIGEIISLGIKICE